MSGRAGRIRRLALGVGALVVAALAVGFAPETEDIVAPFPIRGGAGERVAARTLGAEVTGIRAAQEVTLDYGLDRPALPTAGFWLIVDAAVTTWKERQTLSYASVRIGDATYRTWNAMPPPSLVGFPFDPGVPVEGTLLFELPDRALADAVDGGVEIEFAPTVDPRLDTIATVVADVAELEVEPSAVVPAASVEDRG